MNLTIVDRVVNAVLYEGYLLYPYRPSALKNRQRWTFGGVYPRAYSEATGGSEAWVVQTECLVRGAGGRLQIQVRFLHLHQRTIREKAQAAWQEATEREICLDNLLLADLVDHPRRQPFAFAGARTETESPDGVVLREQRPVEGTVELSACPVGPDLYRLTVRVANLTPMEDPARLDRDEVLLQALVSAHTVLGVGDGEFLSLFDPPDEAREQAAACRNVGTWPVLVGPEGSRNTLLSSPIILHDYPRVAPESPGDFFDATEIDEMLTLRILTLTEEEKREMASGDERGRHLLERTETLARESLLGLHGTWRGLQPVPQPAAPTPRILIAGIGNIFFGDDGFGVEVARRLAGRDLPEGVRVVDFGIRSYDLAFALMDGYDKVILVDALPRAGPPGSLYVLEPEQDTGPVEVDTHGMHPAQVLRLVQAMGGSCPWMRVVGCEPATLGSEDELVMELSEPVRAAVEEAVRLIEAMVEEFQKPVSP